MRLIKFNFDKILYNLVFILASILIISQLALTVNNAHIYTSARAGETTIDITLTLCGTNPNENIAILSNGDVVAYFVNETIKLTVNNNSVLEIDGRKINHNFSVQIKSTTGLASDIPDEISVNSNIAMIGRFMTK